MSVLFLLFTCVIGSVGAYLERSAYLWTRNVSGSSDWQQLSKIRSPEAGTEFGSSVALSGSTMEFVIGGQCPHSCT
jgi:hypothetical protein